MKFFNARINLIIFLAIVLFWPSFLFSASEITLITLNTPVQSCVGSGRVINLTWSTTITGNPDYYILRKLSSETTYTQISGPQNTTSYTDTDVVSDQSYDYQIKAEKGPIVYYSNEVSAADHYCPPMLSFTTNCQSDGPHIDLSWSSVTGDLSSYKIYRDDIELNQTTATTYDDGPSIEGTKTYNYFIQAIWNNGKTINSTTSSIVAPACPPTVSLSSNCLNTQSPGGPALNLLWNNLLGVTGYQIYRQVLDETSYSLIGETTSTNYQDKLVESLSDSYNQTGNISYYVKAKWATDEKNSTSQTISIPQCAPYLTSSSYCNEETPSINITWTKTQNSVHYNIYKDGEFITQVSSNTNSWTDYDILNDSTHSYKVEAVLVGGTKTSNEISQYIDCRITSPPSPAPQLSEPTPICRSGDSQIDLSWTTSNQVTAYRIWRNGSQYVERSTNSYTDSGIESGYNYSYYIEAYNKIGSVFSNQYSSTTAYDCSPPPTPELSLSNSCNNGTPVVSVSWTSTSNTYEYEIKRGLSSDNLETRVIFKPDDPEFSSLTWNDSDVDTNTTYYYQVVAHGPPGTGTDGQPLNTPSSIQSTITGSCLPEAPVFTLSTACQDGNAVVTLTWNNTANTSYYQIFREDAGSDPIQTIYPTNSPPNIWSDTGVSQETTYNYKIVAVGPTGLQTAYPSSDYISITTHYCQPPGPFILNNPTTSCNDSYPQANLSWSTSTKAESYDLIKNQISPSETSITNNVLSPFTDTTGFGKALNFDGYHDYVTIPNSDSLNPTNQITLEAWVYPTHFNYSNIFTKRYPGQYVLRFYSDTGRIQGYFHGGNWYGCTTPSTVAASLNQWNHIVFTYDGNVGKVYINNIEGCSFNHTGTIDVGDSPLRIGSYYTYDTHSERFQGDIDEVRIYNRALSATEVQEHYNKIYNDETGLVGLWHFDEGEGNIVSDSSNYGNNGTIYGASWVNNGLQSGLDYTWQAEAKNYGGTTLSNTTTQETMPYCPPTKPGLYLTPACNGANQPTVNLSWSYSLTATSYEVYRDGAKIATFNQSDPEFDSRTWTDDDNGNYLKPNFSYTYYIKVIGPTGLSTESDHISTTTSRCALPGQPKNLTLKFNCDGYSRPYVDISWNLVNGADYYNVFRDPAGGSPFYTTNNYYTDYYNSVKVNSDYSYYVIAYNEVGAGPSSDTKSIHTGYCAPYQPSITNISTDCQNHKPVNKITWQNRSAFNVTEYQIYRDNNLIATTSQSNPDLDNFTGVYTDTDPNLQASTTYSYYVKAVGPAGQTDSSSLSIKTYSCQPPPTPNLTYSSICTSNGNPLALLGWNKTPETDQYQLYKNETDFYNVSPNEDGFIMDWLLIGPFSYNWADRETAFNTDYIDELNVKPKANETANGKTWFFYRSADSHIDFRNIFSPNEYVIGYAFAYIYSPEEKTVQLRIGSDDGVKVFLNGEEVWSHYTWRGAAPDQDIVNDIHLLAGFNTLLVKVQQGWGGWGFYARLTDTDGNNIINDVTAWDSSVMNNVSLNYYSLSIGPGGTSTPSNEISISKSCLPADVNLTIDSQCYLENSRIYLSWNNDPDGNTAYYIVHKRRQGETTWQEWDQNENYYYDDNVESEVTYEYYVTAVGNNPSYLKDSSLLTATAMVCAGVPSTPNPTAQPFCSGYSSEVNISWGEDTSGNTVKFQVYRKEASDSDYPATPLVEYPASATTFIDSSSYGLEENKTYIYKVVASDDQDVQGETEATTTLSCSTLPPFPSTLSLTDVHSVAGPDTIYVWVSWDIPGNEEGFYVQRKLTTEPDSAYTTIKTLVRGTDYSTDLSNLQYLDYTAEEGTNYNYKIVAYNDNGTTDSNPIEADVPISIPSDFNLSGEFERGLVQVNLNWTAASSTDQGGTVYYTVYRASSNSGPWEELTTDCTGLSSSVDGSPSNLSCSDTNPDLSKRYYKVTAQNNGGTNDSNIIKLLFSSRWNEIIPF